MRKGSQKRYGNHYVPDRQKKQMMRKYILSVDQSTQGTKGMLFDENGILVARADKAHRQIVNAQGWVSHDLSEILDNTLAVCRDVVQMAGIDKNEILAMAISNQRETTAAWDKETGKPLCDAIVWQCSRAREICTSMTQQDKELVFSRTGLMLSPYFPAAKMAWILRNVLTEEAKGSETRGAECKEHLAFGTIDSWLIYSLCEGHPHKCDYSNASRTMLFNIRDLCWDPDLCALFGVPADCLPEVCMSDSCFGYTDLGGFLEHSVPLHGVLGDSHGALLGHGGKGIGRMKATYGTGSSVMMNIGEKPVFSKNGLVTSLAWGLDGQVSYVLEGNLNYTGAVISWLKNEVQMIDHDAQTQELAEQADPNDKAYFVPAFSGLGAPYWDSDATGMLTGVTRTTGKKEIVKACLESIAYQITDLVLLMEQESGIEVSDIRVDGGPTANAYLMQFQADMADSRVCIPQIQELSGMGAAIAAGCAVGLYDYERVVAGLSYHYYDPKMDAGLRTQRYQGWKEAVNRVLTKGKGIV